MDSNILVNGTGSEGSGGGGGVGGGGWGIRMQTERWGGGGGGGTRGKLLTMYLHHGVNSMNMPNTTIKNKSLMSTML